MDNDCEGDRVDRRSFLAGGAVLAGMAGIAGADDKQRPPTRVLDDDDIRHAKVTFPVGKEVVSGFLARPKRDGKFPAVLVIAGNRISEEYIPNTCAALAKAGFVGLAPNLFHPIPENILPDSATGELKKAYDTRPADFLQLFEGAENYLNAAPFVHAGKLGVIGFCMGGRLALLFGVREKRVAAVVAFHPGVTKLDQVVDLHVPVQIHHGTGDRSVSYTHTLELEKALKKQSTPVELFLYDKLDHGFLAYTRPFYDPEGAKLAWSRTLAFLSKHLKE
jgi:carboxymethylenebutenolidase